MIAGVVWLFASISSEMPMDLNSYTLSLSERKIALMLVYSPSVISSGRVAANPFFSAWHQ